MLEKNNKLKEKLLEKMIKTNNRLYEGKVLDIAEIMGNTKKMLLRNFTSGIFRGVGIGIGFYIITAIIVYVLQKIIRLNIPVLSQYIADIVEIVSKKGRTFLI